MPQPSQGLHMPPEPAPGRLGLSEHRTALTWRWYHFYFILALFDVLVIALSFVLYHRALTSYELALGGLSALDRKQQWVTQIRRKVLELNAPGNDVFESQDVRGERARFDKAKTELRLLSHRETELGMDLAPVERHIAEMIQQEEAIFRFFDEIARSRKVEDEEIGWLSKATVSMAAMDRHQAAAMQALSVIETVLQDQETYLLTEYGTQLQRVASYEKYSLGIVGLVLVGVFWYGRKLQRMHERMIESQQNALAERHERLAAVGEVCSAVAHGIRNPLAAITSSAQLALEFGTSDESTGLRLRDVLSESLRLDRRISRLLDFSHGGASVAIPYDLRETVAQAIHEVRPNIENRGIKLETESDAHPLRVRGNPEAMTQCVIELLSNALDHLGTDGWLHVACTRARSRADQAEISVIDNGPGIPKELQTRVFELFFTTKAQGNGIGLASVRRTLEAQNGQVSIIDREQGGTHIKAVLPLWNHT